MQCAPHHFLSSTAPLPQAYAKRHGIPYLETSARDNSNVDEAFAKMAAALAKE